VRDRQAALPTFCDHMTRCYRENLTDMVIFTSQDGTRASGGNLHRQWCISSTQDSDLPNARGPGPTALACGRSSALKRWPNHPCGDVLHLADLVAQVVVLIDVVRADRVHPLRRGLMMIARAAGSTVFVTGLYLLMDGTLAYER